MTRLGSSTRIARDITQRLDARYGRAGVELWGGLVTVLLGAVLFVLARSEIFSAPIPPYAQRAIAWDRCEWSGGRGEGTLVLVGPVRYTLEGGMWAGRYDRATVHDVLARVRRARAWFDPDDRHAIRGLESGEISIAPSVGRELEEQARRGNRDGLSWIAMAMASRMVCSPISSASAAT